MIYFNAESESFAGTNSDEPGKNKRRRRLTYNQEEENHSYQKTQNDLQREFTLYSSDEEMSSKETIVFQDVKRLKKYKIRSILYRLKNIPYISPC